ncbi:MAG: EamA family transporter [Candidatus Aenigmarchaeota archaeon]|nr:EamA family transporter [Candidatus Aenigmarchaeota archaeon]
MGKSPINKHAYFAAVTAATLWGIFFLIAKISLLDLPVFNIIAYRYILACLPFLVLMLASGRFPDKKTIASGVILGSILFTADFSQLTGISLTTVSSSALLSQGLIIFTPVFLLFLGFRIKKFDFLRPAIALIGLYLFAVKEAFSISVGDIFIIGFAVAISVYFIANEKLVQKSPLTSLLAVQFLTEGLLGILFSVATGGIIFPQAPVSWLQILYLGIAATCLGWGLNSWAQKSIPSHHVVIIYILEPLVAGFLAFVFFSETLTIKELIGAALILFAVIMPAIYSRKNRKR